MRGLEVVMLKFLVSGLTCRLVLERSITAGRKVRKPPVDFEGAFYHVIVRRIRGPLQIIEG
jgi:hypothetical protein